MPPRVTGRTRREPFAGKVFSRLPSAVIESECGSGPPGPRPTDPERSYVVPSIFHAEQIKKPLFVTQGANDPRVPKAEADEIVQAVRKNKVPVEYVIFPDEGHGFTKKKNEAEAYSRMLAFLDQYLKKPSTPPAK